jgi:hypothetical protein
LQTCLDRILHWSRQCLPTCGPTCAPNVTLINLFFREAASTISMNVTFPVFKTTRGRTGASRDEPQNSSKPL